MYKKAVIFGTAVNAAIRYGLFGSHYLHIDESDETEIKYISQSNERHKLYNMSPIILSFGLFDVVIGSTSTNYEVYNFSKSFWVSKPFFRPVHMSWSSDRDDIPSEYKCISDVRVPVYRTLFEILFSIIDGDDSEDNIINFPKDIKRKKGNNIRYETPYSHKLHGLMHNSESTYTDNWYILDVPRDKHTTFKPFGEKHNIDKIVSEHNHNVLIDEEIHRAVKTID